MKFSDSKLTGQMRRRPSVLGQLPALDEMPRQRMTMLATGISHRLGHVFTRWLDTNSQRDLELNGPRLMLIVVLSKHNQLTMSDAAELMDVTPRAITRLVDGLEHDGFAFREQSDADKRVVILRITEKGAAAAKRVLPFHEQKANAVFSVFSDQELRTYVELSHKLIQQIKSQEPDA